MPCRHDGRTPIRYWRCERACFRISKSVELATVLPARFHENAKSSDLCTLTLCGPSWFWRHLPMCTICHVPVITRATHANGDSRITAVTSDTTKNSGILRLNPMRLQQHRFCRTGLLVQALLRCISEPESCIRLSPAFSFRLEVAIHLNITHSV
jgi:hypothetical protein